MAEPETRQTPADRSRKRALLVGIDAYSRLGKSWQLRGGVNDVRAMAEYLKRDLGFQEEEIVLLLDGEATRQGILDALEALADHARQDELVVIHYSGHGSRVRTSESRGGDAWEETIVPCDSGRGEHQSRDVTSTEIRRLLLRLTAKTQQLTLIFDCCHSGTLTRDPFAARGRWVPPATEARSGGRGDDGSPPAYVPYGRSYTLIAACRRNEAAREYVPESEPAVERGVLTHFLLEELRRAPAEATWRDVMEKVEVAIVARFRGQHPQLVGSPDRVLFGLDERRPMRYVRVLRHQERRRRMVLDAGFIHGVACGSGWTVYPPGTRHEDEALPLGELRVLSVRATTAEAELLGEKLADVPSGARAVLTSPGDEAAQLRLELTADTGLEKWAGRLASAVKSHPLLALCDSPAGAYARVYLLSSRTEVAAENPVPFLGTFTEPHYAVVGTDGDLLMPARPIADSGTIYTLVRNLARQARWLHALDLRNPQGSLAGAVDFGVLRQRGGSWRPVTSDDAVFEDRERFAVEVRHRHSRPLHVYVLSFSADGEISLVYPTQGVWEPIAPDRTVRYGIEAGDAVRLVLPGHGLRPESDGQVEASEVLKLFATTEATDFRPLFQDRYRQVRGWRTAYQRSRLGRLLCAALAGAREVEHVEGGVAEPWTTVERSVQIRRRPAEGER